MVQRESSKHKHYLTAVFVLWPQRSNLRRCWPSVPDETVDVVEKISSSVLEVGNNNRSEHNRDSFDVLV